MVIVSPTKKRLFKTLCAKLPFKSKEEKRMNVILALTVASPSEVSSAFKIPLTSIMTIRELSITKSSVKDAPRPGAPLKLSKKDQRRLLKLFEKGTNDPISKIRQKFNKDRPKSEHIIDRTISAYGKRMGFIYRSPKRRPQLDERDIGLRREFIIQALQVPVRDIFCIDEKNFAVGSTLRLRKVRISKGWSERKQEESMIYPHAPTYSKVMYFTGVSMGFRLPKIINSIVPVRMKSAVFMEYTQKAVNIMRNRAEPEVHVIQVDRATCHISGISKAYLLRHFREILIQPPHSPDFNYLDCGMYSTLDSKLQDKKHDNTEELKKAVGEIWREYPNENVISGIMHARHNLIRSALNGGAEVLNEREPIPKELENMCEFGAEKTEIVRLINKHLRQRGLAHLLFKI